MKTLQGVGMPTVTTYQARLAGMGARRVTAIRTRISPCGTGTPSRRLP